MRHQASQGKAFERFRQRRRVEVVEDFAGDTYRAVYTVQMKHAVYVLHCFQKKSHKGGKVPKPEQKLIEARLRDAAALDRSKDG